MTANISTQSCNTCLQRTCYKPALVKKSCIVDRELLEKRAMRAVLCSFSILAISLCATIAAPRTIYFIPLAVVPLIAHVFDRYLTRKIAGERAVLEYVTEMLPSREATYCIQNDLTAAKDLVKKRGYRNAVITVNTHGESLLSARCSQDVFRFLMHGEPDIITYFLLSTDEPQIADLLNSKTLTPVDITPCRQVTLWTHLQNSAVAGLLSLHGFNINIRNRNDFTALMELARLNPSESAETRRIVTQIKLLLRCGADKTLKVLVGRKLLMARDLAVDPEIRQPLSYKQRQVKFIF
ncbi:MAG: hypothetical protein NTX49_04345 [Chlamydiae bacterium]|nr:hypothetical protein [Chlamydiota bacterium]